MNGDFKREAPGLHGVVLEARGTKIMCEMVAYLSNYGNVVIGALCD